MIMNLAVANSACGSPKGRS